MCHRLACQFASAATRRSVFFNAYHVLSFAHFNFPRRVQITIRRAGAFSEDHDEIGDHFSQNRRSTSVCEALRQPIAHRDPALRSAFSVHRQPRSVLASRICIFTPEIGRAGYASLASTLAYLRDMRSRKNCFAALAQFANHLSFACKRCIAKNRGVLNPAIADWLVPCLLRGGVETEVGATEKSPRARMGRKPSHVAIFRGCG